MPHLKFPHPAPQKSGEWFAHDTVFDKLYPLSTQLLSQRHWTPLKVAKLAAGFLGSKKGTRILDIGSGVGKFCLAGAHYKPHVSFYGVEQRLHFIDDAERAKKILGLQNAHFLTGNFSTVEFAQFDHFYFYNSFYENLTGKEKLDNSLTFSDKTFYEYACQLFYKLAATRKGTRLVTYHAFIQQIPNDFILAEKHVNGFLECWIKQ